MEVCWGVPPKIESMEAFWKLFFGFRPAPEMAGMAGTTQIRPEMAGTTQIQPEMAENR